MNIRPIRWPGLALTVAALLIAPVAWGQVVVDITGNTAHATILLSDSSGASYDAEVTIVFDTPLNLSAESLNLTAELVDPATVNARLPSGMTLDPAFPLIVTIEPPVLDWIFTTGVDGNDDGSGALSFLNSYDIEIHTHNLVYTPNSPYRLLKAPIGGAFADVTEDVLSGSTRARGRGGAFSQFVIGADSNNSALQQLLVSLNKTIALDVRLLAAVLNDALNLELGTLLADVQTALLNPLLGCSGAIAPLDEFIADVHSHAGTDIANVWRAQHDVTNDAGELESLAQTLRFSLSRCSGSP